MIEINPNLYAILLLIFYVMSIYRCAILISNDVGPLGIFEKIRLKIEEMDYTVTAVDEENETWFEYQKWSIINNLNIGINCPVCTGVWCAIILFIPLYLAFNNQLWSIPLIILGGAGIQTYLYQK